MRAAEVKKHDATFNRGRIIMAIDGQAAEVRKVEQILNRNYENTMCEEEGDNEGEISISYMIDRNDKKEFMDVYTQAKSAA